MMGWLRRRIRDLDDADRRQVTLEVVVPVEAFEKLVSTWALGEYRLRRKPDGRFALMWKQLGDEIDEFTAKQVGARREVVVLAPTEIFRLTNDSSEAIELVVEVRPTERTPTFRDGEHG